MKLLLFVLMILVSSANAARLEHCQIKAEIEEITGSIEKYEDTTATYFLTVRLRIQSSQALPGSQVDCATYSDLSASVTLNSHSLNMMESVRVGGGAGIVVTRLSTVSPDGRRVNESWELKSLEFPSWVDGVQIASYPPISNIIKRQP